MSDAKTYVFGQDSNNLNALLPLLQQKGVDPSIIAMLNNGNFGNNNFIWIIFLFLIFGWGNNGNWGSNNGQVLNAVNDSTGRELLMQAINGNGTAIGQLATKLNCDINTVQTALTSIGTQVSNVGNQVGLTSQQVVNAIQQGNMSLAQQFAQCCCDNKLLVTQMGYDGQIRDLTNTQQLTSQINTVNTGMERGFSSVAYETAQQTCAIQNSMKDQTQTIIDKLNSMEANAQQDKINTLTAQLTAATSRAERAAELKPIIDELNAIKSAQPSTTTIQYPNIVGIPAAQLYGTNTGYWG
jgi:hypothetical protein